MEDGTLKMRVAAPPERGKANRSVIRLLARQLGVSATRVEITSGYSSGRKMVKIRGLDADDVQRNLMRLRG